MVKPRIFGEDTPTMAWIRAQGRFDSAKLPPSEFGNTDVDAICHHYKQGHDSEGVREVQMILQIEFKGFNARPPASQANTLFMQHQALYDVNNQKLKRNMVLDSFNNSVVSLWHFGVSFVSHATNSIANCERLEYGRFDAHGDIQWRDINRDAFLEMLEFRRRPDDLKPMTIRRHHLTEIVQLKEREPLGFVTTLNLFKRDGKIA